MPSPSPLVPERDPWAKGGPDPSHPAVHLRMRVMSQEGEIPHSQSCRELSTGCRGDALISTFCSCTPPLYLIQATPTGPLDPPPKPMIHSRDDRVQQVRRLVTVYILGGEP